MTYCLLKKDNRWISHLPSSAFTSVTTSIVFSKSPAHSSPRPKEYSLKSLAWHSRSFTVWRHPNLPLFPALSWDSSYVLVKLFTFPQAPPVSSNTPAFSPGASTHFLSGSFGFLPTTCVHIRIPRVPSR